MAVIECVINYDEKTKKVSQVVHVLEMDKSDQIHLVTHTKGLRLQCEKDFPLLNLKEGDLAPVKYTDVKTIPPAERDRKFTVYYHGVHGKFACGYLNEGHQFYGWPGGKGVCSPSGDPTS